MSSANRQYADSASFDWVPYLVLFLVILGAFPAVLGGFAILGLAHGVAFLRGRPLPRLLLPLLAAAGLTVLAGVVSILRTSPADLYARYVDMHLPLLFDAVDRATGHPGSVLWPSLEMYLGAV